MLYFLWKCNMQSLLIIYSEILIHIYCTGLARSFEMLLGTGKFVWQGLHHHRQETLQGLDVHILLSLIEKIPIDEIKRELNATGLSEDAIEELLQVLSIKSLTKLEEILGSAGEAVADLKELFSLAEKFGYSEWIQFDASVVRGLAYYTGIVFEGFDRQGKLRAICGGGRYDRLLSTFGGDDVPACGFGFGDAVIVELLKEKGLLPELHLEVDNIVCALDYDLQGVAAEVATKLREKGQSVDLVLESKPLKWVFKRAARTNAQRLVLVGSTEWQKGMVGVKILSSGEQYEIKLDELE
ncbi:histidine--tRNA ligase, chloroplastic/mitochondrial [Gossypium australe]|uniref:histidine--tRNA ligase n=1 Tax=Gossypium australe TaxID=47621 RepID=A0A5B6VB23_9ROSI|nr:histidine--tRNA ligase, chloroplastic/mitochondrial [Gossypium australe]